MPLSSHTSAYQSPNHCIFTLPSSSHAFIHILIHTSKVPFSLPLINTDHSLYPHPPSHSNPSGQPINHSLYLHTSFHTHPSLNQQPHSTSSSIPRSSHPLANQSPNYDIFIHPSILPSIVQPLPYSHFHSYYPLISQTLTHNHIFVHPSIFS